MSDSLETIRNVAALAPPEKPAQAQTAARTKRRAWVFRSTAWDIVPVALLIAHVAALIWLFVAWHDLSWGARLGDAALYALAIGWSLDSVAHNFIHNPFFLWNPLNRGIAYALTIVNGVPQTMYDFVHMKHHAGNSDRKGADGKTIDPISLYKYGADGKPEPMLSYVFLQYWRDDGPFTVAKQIRAKRPKQAAEAMHEFWVMVAVYAALLLLNWQFVLVLAPFYYLGQCVTALIAYYEHLGSDPDKPAAWGVSTYAPVYNWAFLNNGYHAEHHARPKQHWSAMKKLKTEIDADMRAANTRIIGAAHLFGFLEPSSWRIPVAKQGRGSGTAG
jgi:fatty acid desaturase